MVLYLCSGTTCGQVLLTPDCPVCVNVDQLPGEVPDYLAGLYNFKGESAECLGGCSYKKGEDSETVYCFVDGVRTAQLECAATNNTDGTAAAEVSSPTTSMTTSTTSSMTTTSTTLR